MQKLAVFVFQRLPKFTRIIIEVRESWRSGKKSCSNAVGKMFEPVYGCFLYEY